MKKLLSFLLLSSMIGLSACTESKSPCSDAANVDNAECQKQIPDVDTRPLTLDVSFKDSNYFDQNTQEWVTLKKENLAGGLTGKTIFIYSDFLNQSQKALMSGILVSNAQQKNPGQYPTAAYNRVPYLEVTYEDGVDYIFEYEKRNLNNVVVFKHQGKLVIQDGRAILPLVNESFGNQFYAASENIGDRFTHSISIAAQSSSRRGAISPKIVFDTIYEIPNKDFYVNYSAESKSFSLTNRWNYYVKNNMSQPNDRFHLMTLKEFSNIAEQVPVELTITFQTPPKLEIIQQLFFEMPFEIDAIKSTGVVTPQRGNTFYIKEMPLNSDSHFRMGLKMNGQDLTLQSGVSATTNMAAGVPWDIDFYYDFRQNANFGTTHGSLITPLRPVCHQMSGTDFNPILEQGQKSTTINSGGYMAICHPTENKQIIISANTLANSSAPPYSLTDTWNGHFSYVPYDMFKREVGHFYGIRNVTLKISGCVKIAVRKPGETVPTVKSVTHPACVRSGVTNDTGWVYFYAEKQATLFDNMTDFAGVSGLQSLMQSFSTRPILRTQDFLFNGSDVLSDDTIKHIY